MVILPKSVFILIYTVLYCICLGNLLVADSIGAFGIWLVMTSWLSQALYVTWKAHEDFW